MLLVGRPHDHGGWRGRRGLHHDGGRGAALHYAGASRQGQGQAEGSEDGKGFHPLVLLLGGMTAATAASWSQRVVVMQQALILLAPASNACRAAMSAWKG